MKVFYLEAGGLDNDGILDGCFHPASGSLNPAGLRPNPTCRLTLLLFVGNRLAVYFSTPLQIIVNDRRKDY